MSNSQSSNNKRIAKNTILLYFRMFLTMAISLYTSRVVLEVLGVEDFGIYNVVGGLATSFIFFSSSLSNATQRYFNVEIGKNNTNGISEIFSASLIIYIALIVVVVLLSETLGLWFVDNKLTIPIERLDAAKWVFHVTVIGLVLTLISSIFDSLLIAYENMKIYAYLSIFEAMLKLSIVFLLEYIDFDKLKIYAILFLLSHLFIRVITVGYCLKKYPVCRFKYVDNIKLFKALFSFIGWNGFGTAVWMLNEQGINVILNMFFGPVVNAARGVSAQVGAAVNNFSNNFFTAVRPQIVKSYAGGDYGYFTKLINLSSKYSFYLIWFLSLPIIMRSEAILQLWLGNVPDYASEFVQWILMFNCVNVLTNPFWSGVQAIGNLKKYILVGSLVFLSAFPISYVFLKLGYSPVIVFQILVSVRIFYLFVTINIFRQLVNFSIVNYFMQVIYPIVKVFLLSGIFSVLISPYINNDLLGIILMTFFCLVLTSLTIYAVGISTEERKFVISKIHKLKKE